MSSIWCLQTISLAVPKHFRFWFMSKGQLSICTERMKEEAVLSRADNWFYYYFVWFRSVIQISNNKTDVRNGSFLVYWTFHAAVGRSMLCVFFFSHFILLFFFHFSPAVWNWIGMKQNRNKRKRNEIKTDDERSETTASDRKKEEGKIEITYKYIRPQTGFATTNRRPQTNEINV